MMIEKRNINKIANQKIVEENWSHQDTYVYLVANSNVSKKIIAKKLANIPSPAKRNKTKLLRHLFLGLTIAVNVVFFVYTFYGLQLNLMLIKYSVLALIIFVIFVSFTLSYRLKTKFEIIKKELLIDGKLSYEEDFFFCNENHSDKDLLDTEMF